MTLFRVYGSTVWKTWEFGLAFYFDSPFEFALLLGPFSLGIVLGEEEEQKILVGDFHYRPKTGLSKSELESLGGSK